MINKNSVVSKTAPSAVSNNETNNTIESRDSNRFEASNRQDDSLDVIGLMRLFFEYKIIVLCLTVVSLALGILFANVSTKIYSTYALIQIENESSAFNFLEDISSPYASNDSIAPHIEILKSNMVLGPVVKELRLDLEIYHIKKFMGIPKISWDESDIAISMFNVDDYYFDLEFCIKIKDSENYELIFDGVEEIVFNGKVDKSEKFNLPKGDVEIKVDGFNAGPGEVFSVIKKDYYDAVSGLRDRLKIGEKAKKSGVLKVEVQDVNPQRAEKVVNFIVDNFVRQNVERTASEQEKSVEFLKEQLPNLKLKLENAEKKFNQYRSNNSSVNLSVETEGLLQRIVEIDTEIFKARQEIDSLKTHFTSNHPKLKALNRSLRNLILEKTTLEKRSSDLPTVQQEILRLSRDVEVNTELYTKLLGVSQQLEVAKAGAVGNARVLDYAFPAKKPIKPKKSIILATSLFFGLLVSLVSVLILRKFRGDTIDELHSIEDIGLQVYASIPRSKLNFNGSNKFISEVEPNDPSIEAIRSLRTSLQVMLLGAKNNILMITGASPSIGKSFLSVNLSAVFSKTGKKVLLIDSDLRRGTVHEYCRISNNHGLSEILNGEQVRIFKAPIENLYVIPRGKSSHESTELLERDDFPTLLSKLSKKFDLIIIDTPPVLAVSDASIVGRYAGSCLFVFRHKSSRVNEVKLSIKRLEQANVKVNGAICNFFSTNNYQYGYKSQYEYLSKNN